MCEEAESIAETDVQEFKLGKQTEFRFEVEVNRKVTLELKSGTAEIFGSELVKSKKYVFANCEKIPVFTWYGCVLELIGKPEAAYVAEETPMPFYANIHAALEEMRRERQKKGTKGPVVLVTGPSDVGKSSLCRILVNYSVRLDRRPVFVDLDAESSSISIPGTLAALSVERVADVEEGFHSTAPIVFHYGHLNPGSNINLYNLSISRISEIIATRAAKDRRVAVSGSIINTGGCVNKEDYQAVKHAALAFEVDIILVIDQEKIFNQLDCDIKSAQIILVPKSAGVVKRSQRARAEHQSNCIRNYFYGLKTHLFPYSLNVKFSDIRVFKIGTTSMPEEDSKVIPIPNGPKLLHHVLSVSFAEIVEDVLITNVAGFVCVTNVDMERQTMTVLAPQPTLLPRAILLIGDIQFVDIQY